MAQRPPAAVFGDGSHGTVSAPSVIVQNTSRVVTKYDRRVPKGPMFGDARYHFSLFAALYSYASSCLRFPILDSI